MKSRVRDDGFIFAETSAERRKVWRYAFRLNAAARRGRFSAAVLALSLALLATVGPAPAFAATQIDGVRLHEAPDHTRVVLDVSAPVRYEVSTLKNPHRVVIDLEDATLGSAFNRSVAAQRTRIRQLRTSPRGNGQRLVLDTTGALTPKAFALTPVSPYGHRLVIDLFGGESGASVRRTPPPPRATGERPVLVMVDAGHGGEDPGASGPNKLKEKDVVLAISKQLVERLEKRRGISARLVRTGDYYLGLEARSRMAREARADLLVSIHADAFKEANVHGASVYTLSRKGASSEAARWLAEKENRSDLIGGVGRVTLTDKPDLLKEVLIDMSTHANRALSNEAGRAVLSRLEGLTKLHKSSVEHANFIVLRAPDIPSMLIETGFISNPQEARRLATRRYQNQLAEAIAGAVSAYFHKAPPPGTWLAKHADAEPQRHVIRRGETLSGLASRYGVPTRRLKEANGLASDAIRIGQTLIIPIGG